MEFITQFLEYMQSGGYVMWPLAASVVVLWYALGFRFHSLKRGSNANVRNLVRKYDTGARTVPRGVIDSAIVEALSIVNVYGRKSTSRKYLDDAFNKYKLETTQFETLIKTIVVAAPLIGLLGTVIGMIETFDSLASASLFSQTGGIAGGISQALFTTQFGLVVAVPGLIIGKILDRKADTMELELEQIKDILCSEGV
ncbi:MAG: MotA/TolQ/ExbB proton channel family protein [Sulfurimonas sp.]|jgi:biopolymer transport protein ExbB|nr:MotA/TolQ/ExbB proton channel family protein [Sulfurimonas sp.]MBU3940211.1 MotA/TolQ/ExbB proton channel family protein [bacterium]MBU4024746.1 MotA/TolQ/ExbB proton channel family protein [bacterium]MBU4058618.1 MotA/TolQ/ExbB proton channel family protein [bacterium]MBU4111168.1 MotA/TolQ/ExbB proton channel family protein [bacterium]